MYPEASEGGPFSTPSHVPQGRPSSLSFLPLLPATEAVTLFLSLSLHSPSISIFKRWKKRFDYEAFLGLFRLAKC